MHYTKRCTRSLVFGVGVLVLLFDAVQARAQPNLLPYSTRTHAYSGENGTVSGDIRTLGMSGAVVGLADTFASARDNPAGLAMTVSSVGVQISGNTIHDSHIQDYSEPLSSKSVVIGANFYPWGLSFDYSYPQSEGQTYLVPPSGAPAALEVLNREIRISGARLFPSKHLSIGMSLTFGQAALGISSAAAPQLNSSYHTWDIAIGLGALLKLPHRWLAGLSYTTPMNYAAATQNSPSPGIAQYNQSLLTPYRLGFGVGWIPNRFFRGGFSIKIFGATPGAALLMDDSRLVGQTNSIQPRIGAAYTVAEYKELSVEVSAGTYYEQSRIAGASSRLHATAGLEFNPWIINLGLGMDKSAGYQNLIISAGIDIVRAARKMDLIEREWHAPYGGFLPPPFLLSHVGLPRPINPEWEDHGGSTIIEQGKALPEKLESKMKQAGKGIGEVFNAFGNMKDRINKRVEEHKEEIKKEEKKSAAEDRKNAEE